MKKINKETYICDCCGGEIIIDYDNMSDSEIKTRKALITKLNFDHEREFAYIHNLLKINVDVCGNCLTLWFEKFKNNPWKER